MIEQLQALSEALVRLQEQDGEVLSPGALRLRQARVNNYIQRFACAHCSDHFDDAMHSVRLVEQI